MKWKFGAVCLWFGCMAILLPARGAETNTAVARVGVYDSRAVVYAWFTSDTNMAKLKAEVAAAQAAKASGNDAKFKELSTALRAKQDQIHREVFSTAPAEEAMAEIKNRIPEIEKAAGVSDLVSKWDVRLSGDYKGAEQVDVTGQLVRAFITPTDKQLKMIESVIKSQPLPLDKCNELIKSGQI
jgi:hypothetical protein